MPDSKITALTSIGASTDPANDPLVLVDVSDTSMAATGTTKKVTLNQLLATSPSATLASATITGDLTVDTSTLYVSSSADKVGIGTTSLSNEKLTVAGNISANAWLGRSNISVPAGDCSIFRSADNTLGFGIASSTAMTLNSTGLGVGRSPSYRLQASSGTKATTASLATVAGITTTDTDDFGIYFRLKTDATGANRYAAITSFDNGSGNGARDLVLQDLGGNVGIGVTPSAKLHVEGGGAQGRFSVASASDSRHEYFRNSVREGLIGWDANLFQFIATQATGELALGSGNTIRVRINSAGDTISNVTGTAPTLTTNSQMVFNLTSNTNLRISVRGSDGVTRVANITLA